MSADNDPSMDDILASIRKIISDDEARAQVSGTATPSSIPANAPPLDLRSGLAGRSGLSGNREDVLLLTDLIEEPRIGAIAPEPAPPTPMPMPRIDPIQASEMPQPTFHEPPPAKPMAPPKMMEAPLPPEPVQPSSASSFEPSIVASGAAGVASSAFDRLNQAVEESKATEQSAAADAAPAPSLALGSGGKTIEDLVKELLRPLLKDWIDRSLPPMVERLVEREIARLTRR